MSDALRVVLLEDDPLQAEDHADKIRQWHPEGGFDPEVVPTESQFRARLERGDWDGAGQPDAFILDVMVPWAAPSPRMPPPPPDVVDGGYFRAGIRCAQMVRGHFSSEPRPAIALLTVLDRSGIDVPPGTRYFGKEGALNDLKRWLESLRDRSDFRRPGL